jgi:hypothetical protein
VEENVVTPSTTVVEDDGSWIGRTIVTLVILGLLVAGAVWLVRSLADNDNGSTGNNGDNRQIEQNQNNTNPDTDNNTGNVEPSGVIPS